MTKVLVVEDQRIHREYMENLLLYSGRYQLLQSVTAADVALQLCRYGEAELVLMDIAVNGAMDGIEAAAEIKKIRPQIKIVIVTSMLDAECVERAKAAKVDSMWYKDASVEALLDVMDRTMAGERVFPDGVPEVTIGFATSKEFTKAEIVVLREIVNGLSNKQIAEKHGLKRSTIEWHVGNLLSKTGLSNRTMLAIQAAKGNLFIVKDQDYETE